MTRAGLRCGLPLLLLLPFPLAAQTNLFDFHGTARKTALLELYTSEGCNSCPPAEAWLSGLKSAPGLWRDFVPVALHVDYWNNLGWKDGWSDAKFTDRQRAYAAQWKADTIYTPAFVLDGAEWREWQRQETGPAASTATAGVLKAESADGRRWRAEFEPAGGPVGRYQLHAGLLASGLSSDVTAGENKGRHLDHDFIVLNLLAGAMTASGDKAVRGEFELPAPLKTAAAGRLAVAVWVTAAGKLDSLQATGGWLDGVH